MNSDGGDSSQHNSSEHFEKTIRSIELGFEAFKWLDGQGTEAIKVAARTLWLSNAGGLALIVGLTAKLETVTGYAASALGVSAIAFTAGIVLGVLPHVKTAHRITKYQMFIADRVIDFASKQKTKEVIQNEFTELMSDFRKRTGVITDYLVWAQWSLVCGAVLGVAGLVLIFVPLRGS